MNAAWMVYAICVGLLLTCAAIVLESSRWGRTGRSRVICFVMLIAALLWPVTVGVLGRAKRVPPAQSERRSPLPPVPAAKTIATTAAPVLSPFVPLPPVVSGSPTLDRLALRIAVITPLFAGGLLLLEIVRIRRARRRWEARVVDGVPVLVSTAFGPAIVGIFNPEIVLPAWALELPPDQRALLLTHESEHLVTHDSRWLSAAFAAVVLAPWNVGLWWLLRRLRLAMELECDRRVLLAGHDVGAYGNLLLEIGRRDPGRSLLATGFAERRSMLRTRILNMTSDTRRSGSALAWRVVAGAVLVLGACMLGPSHGDAPIRFSLAPGVADSTVKAKGHLSVVGVAHDLPAVFRLDSSVNRALPTIAPWCPVALIDDHDGTRLTREAEEDYFEPLPAGVSRKDAPSRTIKQIVGYYSIRPAGRYGVDSTHWLRVGCAATVATANTHSNAANSWVAVDLNGKTEDTPVSVSTMLDRYPVPTDGKPFIAIAFTQSSVRVGETVELVTVTWFPRELRNQLHKLPIISAPKLNGLSNAAVQFHRLGAQANGGGGIYDEYVSWRSIRTTVAGRIEASPAVLSYQGPLISPFGGAGDWKRFQSQPAVLVVRP